MKKIILPLIMAFLVLPIFADLGNLSAIPEQYQDLMNNTEGVNITAIAEQYSGMMNDSQNITAVPIMITNTIRNQIQAAKVNGSLTRMMVQNTAVQVLGNSVNVEAVKDNVQRIVMNANMLRINNEELFNESSSVMAKINAAIMNKGKEYNLSIQSMNGELIMSHAESGINVRIRNQEMIIRNNSIFLNISNNEVELSIIPQQAMISAKVKNNSRADVELIIEQEIPKYQIMEQKAVRILGLFQANMNVDSKINALTGELESQIKPWWSFLTTE
jgi:hypothetical protein